MSREMVSPQVTSFGKVRERSERYEQKSRRGYQKAKGGRFQDRKVVDSWKS